MSFFLSINCMLNNKIRASERYWLFYLTSAALYVKTIYYSIKIFVIFKSYRVRTDMYFLILLSFYKFNSHFFFLGSGMISWSLYMLYLSAMVLNTSASCLLASHMWMLFSSVWSGMSVGLVAEPSFWFVTLGSVF